MLRGGATDGATERVADAGVSTAGLKTSMRELDRSWGKAPEFASIEGADPLELDEVAAEVRSIADELRVRDEKV